jgi:hypothetical protein
MLKTEVYLDDLNTSIVQATVSRDWQLLYLYFTQIQAMTKHVVRGSLCMKRRLMTIRSSLLLSIIYKRTKHYNYLQVKKLL